ncbi:MAG: hypothetical protein JST93_26455 [Acidobacteria bacterium]|nr:hypothetical protein [Acidobacteriota bacterium]
MKSHIRKTRLSVTILCYASVLLLLQVLPLDAEPMKISVHRHPLLTDITSDVAEAVVAEAQRMLSKACRILPVAPHTKKEWRSKGKCVAQFKVSGPVQLIPRSFTGDEIESLKSMNLAPNSGFDDAKVSAAQEGLRTGTYGRETIVALSLLNSAKPGGVELLIVPAIKSNCDMDTSKKGFWDKGGLQADGCATINGRLAIVKANAVARDAKNRLDRTWVHEQANLWLHELSHLVGMRHLADAIPEDSLRRPHPDFAMEMEHPWDYWQRLLKAFVMGASLTHNHLLMCEEWPAWSRYKAGNDNEPERFANAVDEALSNRKYLEFLAKVSDRYWLAMIRNGKH